MDLLKKKNINPAHHLFEAEKNRGSACFANFETYI